MLEPSRALAAKVQPNNPPFDTCELNVSISEDRQSALDFAKTYVSHILPTLRVMGFSDDEIFSLGVEPKLIDQLEDAFESGATISESKKLVPDEAVGSCFVAGTPDECREQILELMDEAHRLKFGQVCFSKLGPNYEEAITLLRQKVLNK